MKKIICFVLLLVFLVSAAACDENKDVGSITDIIKDVLSDNNLTEGKIYTSESETAGEYLDDDMIKGYYGNLFESPDFSLIDEYCVYIQDKNPLLQIEIGIFKVIDSNNNAMVRDFLQIRQDTILKNAVNYPSVDTEPFDNVIIDTVGNYTYYIAVKENRDEINKTITEKLNA